MNTITTTKELIDNLKTIEQYLASDNKDQAESTTNLIKNGICFLAYQFDEEIRFAPSRFIGYKKNTLKKHDLNLGKHGNITNPAITNLLLNKPLPSKKLESDYKNYCLNLGITPKKTGSFGHERKYWHLNLDKDFEENLEMTGEFPEGRIVERKHKTRERNSEVIQIAKANFKSKHGRLFCEICGFDFLINYGDIGYDFIEAHHTIPVSEMTEGHTTRPEDIALICSNCHRMLHKKRPWLSMKDMKEIKNVSDKP